MTGRAAVAMLLLACAVAAPSAAAADGIAAGEELALAAGGPGIALQATPALAFGQGLYLAVWREGWHGRGGAARIRALRVSAEGKPLDDRAFEIAPAQAGVQELPRVAFSGGVFLVVWQDLRNGKDFDVLAARVAPDGRVLDREPIAVAAWPRTQALPDVAGDGTGFLVVWQGLQGLPDLPGVETAYRGFAAAVSAGGKVGPLAETGMTPQPRVAWNGARYLAACGGAGSWSGNVQVVQLDAAGAPQGKPVDVVRGTKAAVFSLAGVPGQGWLVVSHRSPPDPWGWGGPGAMRAVLVDGYGRPVNTDAVKEPAGLQRRLPGWLDVGREKTAAGTWPWGESAAAFDGRQAVVVWTRHHLRGEKMTNFVNSDLVAARVDGFESRDPEGVPVAAGPLEESHPALAGDGAGRLLLLYVRQAAGGGTEVAGRMLTTRAP